MRYLMVLMIAVLPLVPACEQDKVDNTKAKPAATAPGEVREGPAERAGRKIDEATREATEAVGQAIEKAGKQVKKNAPPAEPAPAEPREQR